SPVPTVHANFLSHKQSNQLHTVPVLLFSLNSSWQPTPGFLTVPVGFPARVKYHERDSNFLRFQGDLLPPSFSAFYISILRRLLQKWRAALPVYCLKFHRR